MGVIQDTLTKEKTLDQKCVDQLQLLGIVRDTEIKGEKSHSLVVFYIHQSDYKIMKSFFVSSQNICGGFS